MSGQHETPHTREELREEYQSHDEWFRHGPDEPHHQQAHGDFNPYVVMSFLLATIAVVAVTVFVVVPWFGRLVQAQRLEVREENSRYTAEHRAKMEEWNARLYDAPDWVNEQEGVIRVPVDTAMELVVAEYATERE